jgi:SAM-dependent methyltransferase
MTRVTVLVFLADESVNFITCFVTLHHVADLEKTLRELTRISQPGGYLVIREHDCASEFALQTKYLHYVHAIMMIAGVGEFADKPSMKQLIHGDVRVQTNVWKEQKRSILEYTRSIHYRSADGWRQALEMVGFRMLGRFSYGSDSASNPQALFYAIYRKEASPYVSR